MEATNYLSQAENAEKIELQMIVGLLRDGWKYDETTGIFTHPDFPQTIIQRG